MNRIIRILMVIYVIAAFPLLPETGLAEDSTATSDNKNKKEKSVVLDEMVVSGSTTDVKLLETPGTVNIFTAEDIEKGGYVDVADVIKGLPGITDSTTNPATPKYNFRGTAYAHSRGATVYVDGRELNLGRIGYGDLSFVDLNDVEQIQVIKTPGAQFAEPSRGIIYITTKKGKESGHQQRVQVSYGSWGLHSENVSASGKTDKHDYRISAMNQGGEGYRRTDDHRKGVSFKTGYSFDESARLGFGGGYKDQSYFSNTSLEKWQWDRDPRDSTPPSDQDNDEDTYDLSPYEYDVEIYDLFAEFNMDRDRWFTKSMVSLVHNETEYLSGKNQNKYELGEDKYSYLRDYNEDRFTFKSSGGYKLKGDGIQDTLTVGMEYDDHDYDQVRTYPFLAESNIDSTRKKYMRQYNLDIAIDRISLFLNNDLKWREHFSLQTALRYDDVDLVFNNRYRDDPKVKNNYHETSWNISPAYSFTGKDNLYFTASQSYFYPNIDYTRMSAQKKDEYRENDPSNLKPEDIRTYELGFKHQFHRCFNYSIAVFDMTVEDKFIFQYRYNEEEEDWDSLGACNLGKAVHKGLEIEVDGWPTDWLNYRLNYGYLDAEWDDPDAVYSSYIWEDDPEDDYREGIPIDGKKLYRTPENKVTATLSLYPVQGLLAWVSMTYVDDQYVDYMERVVQPSVTTVDCKLAYTFDKTDLGIISWDKLTLHGLVKNLGDQDYAYYSNSRGERNEDGTLATNYYVYPGRYYEVGVTMDF